MRYQILLFFGVLLFQFGCDEHEERVVINENISLSDLKVEFLTNPEGIGEPSPDLSWIIQSKVRNTYQTSYQVLVASEPELLSSEKADFWNSGKVESRQSSQVTYAGKPLDSNTKCYWKVKVWTNQGVTEWSDVGYWSIGLLYYKDWWGRWIGFDRAFSWESIETIPTLGARYFRTEFTPEKEIKSATAYLIGLGLYEFYLNGERVGDAVLAPTPTDYVDNVKYNAYNVTEHVKSGEPNAVGVALGNGRYFTMRQDYKPYKIKTYGFPKMVMHMVITYTDGTQKIIYSSDKWKGTADGPIRNNNEYDGEYYDARKEFTGWTVAGFDDSKWLDAEYVQEPRGDFEAQMNENMKVMKTLSPRSITQLDPGTFIMDMGQNMVGWVEMKVEGNRGDKVQLRFAESLNEDGSLFMTNLRDAQVTDTYILRGGGEEVWEPAFTYHGFRYVEITGYPESPEKDDFVGKMIYDDMETVGTFETSDSTMNQIFENAWWGIAGNYKGMPVDCPQRNERQPWLGDRAVGSYGESFMFDNTRLYKKWLDDIRYAQKADGSIPDVAPPYWNYYSDNMSWPATFLLVAEMVYKQTGDQEVIERNYPAMRKWLSYMKARYMDENGIITKDSYGDWVVPPPSIEAGTGQNADVKRPSKLISTAYYFYFMDLMSEFAELVGKTEDIAGYQKLKKELYQNFNTVFYNQEGFYGDNKMTDNILPLYFGLVPEEYEKEIFEQIVQTIEVENNGHLSTGLIGTQWLMRTLTRYGRVDLAVKLAFNRTYPSWGYMLEHGATTIWELWHGNVANPKMNSQNHVMLLGDLIVWYYESLVGIKAIEPGFDLIEMNPSFPEDLDYVNGSYKSIKGQIVSSWERSDSSISWHIVIPANSKAHVHFPVDEESDVSSNEPEGYKFIRSEKGRLIYEIGSGDYQFSLKLN